MDNDDRDDNKRDDRSKDRYHHGRPAVVEHWAIDVSIDVLSPHQTLADYPPEDAVSPQEEEEDDNDEWISLLTPFRRHVASECPLNHQRVLTDPAESDDADNYGYDFHRHVFRRSPFSGFNHPLGIGSRPPHTNQNQHGDTDILTIALAVVGAVVIGILLIVAVWLVYYCVRRIMNPPPPVLPDLLAELPVLAAAEEDELEDASEEDEV